MPSKRHKTVESAAETEPAPKRRSTRSSTKAATIAQETTHLQSSTEAPKHAPKRKETSKPTPKTKQKSKPQPPNSHLPPKDTDTSTNPPTSSTITHPSIKSPVSCHSYPVSTGNAQRTSTQPTLIFTHGAGGTLSAPAVVNFCTAYSSLNSPIFAFQGSMNLKSRVKSFHACISHIRDSKGGENEENGKLVLGGRSMGARAAVIAAAEYLEDSKASKNENDVGVDLVLVSYPLQGPKDVRDRILLDLPAAVRVLFVVGDRDSMCPLDMLRDVRGKMEAQNWLVVVKGADHGMSKKGMSEQAGKKAAEWVGGASWDSGQEVEVG